jgi:hypothetical protein
MYEDWPFFAATIDLIEMILAKADMRIAALYDDVLVSDPAGKKLGIELRQKFGDCVRAICEVRAQPVACSRRGYRGITCHMHSRLCLFGDTPVRAACCSQLLGYSCSVLVNSHIKTDVCSAACCVHNWLQ